MDDETRSTHSSDAEKTNKQKVSDRLSVENLNIKKRLSISSDLLSNSDILPDKTKSTGGSDEPSRQEPKIESDINIKKKYNNNNYYKNNKELILEDRADHYNIY